MAFSFLFSHPFCSEMSVKVAQLALKHRSNKNGGQRIIVFVGSHISEDPKNLARLGKNLKKSGIALDVISLGDDLEQSPALQALVEATDKSGSSHLVHIPSGVGMIADMLLTTPIFFSEAAGGDAPAAAGGGEGGASAAPGRAGGFPMGVDPNVDPELYEAIQASLRDQQEREGPPQDSAPGKCVRICVCVLCVFFSVLFLPPSFSLSHFSFSRRM